MEKVFAIRGANWVCRVSIDVDGYKYEDLLVEAATRALESIYKGDDGIEFTKEGEVDHKLGTAIQVCEDKFWEITQDPEQRDEYLRLIKCNMIQLIPSHLVLANAGKYAQAELFIAKMDDVE